MKKLLVTIVALTLGANAAAATIEVTVYGLVCGFCAQGIEKALRKKAATADVVVSLENQLVAVATREGTDLTDEEVTKALTDAGYDVRGITRGVRTLDEIRASLKAARK